MPNSCKACNDPLLLTLEPEESGDEETSVPDDLLLPCSCHFHWACLMDHAPSIVASFCCPCCNTHLATSPSSSSSSSGNTSQILTLYTNEGGPQPNLDILPVLREEAYLSFHHEARPARAMHTMVAEGDVTGIISLLSDIDNDSEVDITAAKLLPWTDPLNGGKSAIHVAVESNQEEVFWLLLWLGSNLFTNVFPTPVIQTAGAMGLTRRDEVPVEEDVRFVKDEAGRTVKDVCLQSGQAPWTVFVEGGLFN
ncbi:hypothetical protein V8F20_011951 [Naviculisporaceae sp. PSN 640]